MRFVLISYGKTHRHGDDCHEGSLLYSEVTRNRKHGIGKHPGQSGVRESEGKMCARASRVVFTRRNRQVRVNRLGIG